MKIILSILLSALTLATSVEGQESIVVEHPDFKMYYDSFQVRGSFVLYDQKKDKYDFYNPSQLDSAYTPASTFKICNSLIGLETGVIPDENYVIPWDSMARNPVWDKDFDLRNAYRYSVVWYYQELARRVGLVTMKDWLEKADYGNANTNGGIDLFWLTGGLRITPRQQIEFLKRLKTGNLPFSRRSVDIVKDIMLDQDYSDFEIRAKTGWGGQGNREIGWYVGYVTTEDNVYYFANLVQVAGKDIEELDRAIAFDNSRKEITYQILKQLIP